MELVKYEAARKALAEAKDIDEVKTVKDKAEALRLYAIQAKDIEMEIAAAEIKLRAQRKIGELSLDLEKAKNESALPEGGKTKKEALKDADLSTSTANRFEQIAKIPETSFEEFIRDKREKNQPVSAKEVVQMTGKRTRRKEKVEKLEKRQSELPQDTYSIIYADPPWKYNNVLSESRLIENQYPTMDLDEIKALDVPSISAPDAVLFLWATSPGLEEALEVMGAWGFSYKSCAVWVKPSIGAGYWFRQRHEILLLGTKGDIPVPAEANRPDSVIESPRRKHSQKPDEVYDLIEKGYPEFSKIELFSRQVREGWSVWGFESDAALA